MCYRRIFDVPTFRVKSTTEEFDRMRRFLGHWLEEVTTPYQKLRSGVFPLINLTEDKNSYYVRAELPGVNKEDLDIQATAKSLSISGERKIQSEEKDAKYHRRERESGCFSRVLTIPGEINPDHVSASLVNGILTITVPTGEVAKPKT